MDSDEELAAPAASLSERLHRLTQRRRAAAAELEASSDEEAQAPSMSGAMQALRDLIEQRDVGLVPADNSEVEQSTAVADSRDSTPTVTLEPAAAVSPKARASMPRFGNSEAESADGTSTPAGGFASAACTSTCPKAGPLERQMQGATGLPVVYEANITEAPQVHLNALLAQQAAAAELRKRQRQERQAQLLRVQLAFAQQHMAVWRICRAWHLHLGSPARLRRAAAATAVQAAWRGFVSRRLSAALLIHARQRRALLAALRLAITAKQQQQAREFAEQLTALGCGLEARELTAGLELQASPAALALQRSAVHGSGADFQAAAAEAGEYSDLMAGLQQASSVFQARVAAAELEVERTLQEATIAEFQQAAAAAAALGASATLLQHAQQRMTHRNLQASAWLRAAVNAIPFSEATFDGFLQLAHRYGLHGDVQRAQRALQLRRRRAALRLLEAAEQADAVAVETSCVSAEQLGLAAEAEAARERLGQRQSGSLHALLQASHHGCLQQFTAAADMSERLGWQALQRPLLARMVAAAQQATGGGDSAAGEPAEASTAQLAGCGLAILDLAAMSSAMPVSSGLARLRHLDLSENRLTSAALAAASLSVAVPLLTELKLAGNQVTDLAWMGFLANLLRLDISHNSLCSLEGLAEAAPLLQLLEASHNTLTSLPQNLHLIFLREMWLEGNQLAEAAPAWPWLPSLQHLHLGSCCLSTPPPLQGFHWLHTLDLSCNRLASLPDLLTALAPLRGCLKQLNVSDNPLSQQQASHQQLPAAACGQHQPHQRSGCRGSLLAALPLLQQLDSQPVTEAEQQHRRLAAAARWRPSLALSRSSCIAEQNSMDWDVLTLLWMLHQPGVAIMSEQSGRQQHAFDALAAHQRPPGETQCSLSLAAALAAVQHAASLGACGVSERLRRTYSSCIRISHDGSRLPHLHLLHEQYQLLAAAGPSAAQDLQLINASHYQRLYSRLQAAATAIQAAWRHYAACAQARRLAEQQQASREQAAAAGIQAAWRGWVCRMRGSSLVQGRLASWRHQWREAQQLALCHQQHLAAARIQAAWRGWQVRNLVLQARAALLLQHGRGSAFTDDSLEHELPDSPLSLSSFQDSSSRPEALCPELAVGASEVLGHARAWGAAGTIPDAAIGVAQPQPTSVGSASQPSCSQQAQGAAQEPGGDQAAGGDEDDWEFSDPATAAAFAQMRQSEPRTALAGVSHPPSSGAVTPSSPHNLNSPVLPSCTSSLGGSTHQNHELLEPMLQMQQLGLPWPSHRLSNSSFSPQFGAASATQTEALSFLQQHDLLAVLEAPPTEAQLRHLLTIAPSNAGALPDQAVDAEVAAAAVPVAVSAAPSRCGAPIQGAHAQAGSLRQYDKQRLMRQPMQQQDQQLFSHRYGGSSAAVPVSKRAQPWAGIDASTTRAQRRSGSGCLTSIDAASEGSGGAQPLHFHAGGASGLASQHPDSGGVKGVTWDRQLNQWRAGVPTDWACQIGDYEVGQAWDEVAQRHGGTTPSSVQQAQIQEARVVPVALGLPAEAGTGEQSFASLPDAVSLGAAGQPLQHQGWQRQGSGLPSGVAGCSGSMPGWPQMGPLKLGSSGRKRQRAADDASVPSLQHLYADDTAGLVGVHRVATAHGPKWRAVLSLNLGLHSSAVEAATAHDKAALSASGFLAPLNSNLQAACAAAAAATAEGRRLALQQQEQQEDATVPQQHEIRYRGVLHRSGTAPGILGAGCGTWLALLDLGGSPYELGPFVSALEAARAFDRYSILLHGATAETNFPAWEYLASTSECQALVAAVTRVQQQAQRQAQQQAQQPYKWQATPQAKRHQTPPPDACW
ncbi:hypothetical protein D9Q98_001264 [Chlorella vulgaris]|uniref:AP2/ERF domain-containing protein n=1 Tax=Chlorella vulgaris TaxID=3077 RepID=A0A9D4Z2X4_CHLVU|nr:hypothetical protein D9Q98_001264 [Chlorella vulgaris]